MIFLLESTSTLVSVLTDEISGTPELDKLRSGTLAEVGNILLFFEIGFIRALIGAVTRVLKP